MQYMKLEPRAREVLLNELASMPDFVVDAFAHLDSAALDDPGRDGSFAPVEHAWHLADLEREGFAERIERLRKEVNPSLPDFVGDVVARERNYRALSFAEGINSFRQARRQNIERLRGIAADEWANRGSQDGYGAVTLCDIPAMMAAHDDSHRMEIRAWLAARDGTAHTDV